MATIIRVVNFANGVHCQIAGQWVETFDHDAYNGQGYGTFTDDKSKAMRFASHGEAFEFWRRVSTVNPTRPDGKPNRPLTACTATFDDPDRPTKDFPPGILDAMKRP